PVENLAYGIMVQSTIARGTIERIDTTAAEQLPGVIKVLTQDNMPKLESLEKFRQKGGGGVGGSGGGRPTGRALSLFQDDEVHYNGQPIALVIAESLEVAMQAASLVRAIYRPGTPTIEMATALPSAYPYTQKVLGREPPKTERGDLQEGLAAADARIDAAYSTPLENHNPL